MNFWRDLYARTVANVIGGSLLILVWKLIGHLFQI